MNTRIRDCIIRTSEKWGLAWSKNDSLSPLFGINRIHVIKQNVSKKRLSEEILLLHWLNIVERRTMLKDVYKDEEKTRVDICFQYMWE